MAPRPNALPVVPSATLAIGPLDNVKHDTNQTVVSHTSNPISAMGGIAGADVLSAPVGAIVKVAGMSKLTSSVARRVAVAAMIAFTVATIPAAARDSMKFVSPEAALEQGLGAYRSGLHTIAEKALAYAAERGSLLGKWYLSRLYSDPNSALTDHAKAYELLYSIVNEHAARIDVDDDPRASYVGRALTGLAGYWLRGLPEFGIKPNAERAAGYLQEAATFFRNQDAQFELAKLYLTGEGVPLDQRQATARLASLSKSGHPGAQAFLADLYWRGKVLKRDESQALALITLAVENAPPHERIWIEDIYHSIYCGLSAGVRRQSEGLIASFRQRYSPRPGTEPQDGLGTVSAPIRTCADGTPLPVRPERDGAVLQPGAARTAGPPMPDALQSGVLGISGTPRR
ncbi:MAG: sel1 repeat family protein [Hyphomicrobiaceae bacterium]|nr:sel1 repeat family protein [Hyphomicrobiaceae bacterium]